MNSNPLPSQQLGRRQFLSQSAIAGISSFVGFNATGTRLQAQTPPVSKPSPRFKFCLNTSTIRKKQIPLDKEIELIAKAGYDAIEPWMNEIQQFKANGGNLKDLRKKISDLGLTVESAIGFANWISDDATERSKGLENAKKDMDLLKEIGGIRIAAPPVGAQAASAPKIDLFAAAERYAALLEVGRNAGVLPQLELWGFSKNLSRLGEVAFVAIESGHPDACVLTDVYHIYKGGSDFNGLKLFAGSALTVLHMNDYPANPPRQTIADKDRVYPGDGIAPISDILQKMAQNGFAGVLSLELFNETYWNQDPEIVLMTGLQKMKSAVQHAFPQSA